MSTADIHSPPIPISIHLNSYTVKGGFDNQHRPSLAALQVAPFALPLDTDLPHSVDLLAIVAILKVLRLDGRLLARMGAVEELCGVRSTGTSLEADLCLLEVGSIGFGAA